MTEETKVDEPRTCLNCACRFQAPSIETTTGLQSFCRRNTPGSQMVSVEVPRLDRHKQPVFRDGKPVMEVGKARAYGYPPTEDSMVCFDGWRPVGTLPGDKDDINKLLVVYSEQVKKLWNDLVMQQLEHSFPNPDENFNKN